MKKLIALIVTLSVMLGMCTTAFAATVSVDGAAITKNDDGTYTVNAALAELKDGDDVANNTQNTIVVISGTEINTSSIQYINQQSKEEGTSFTFVPKDEAAFLETDTDVTLTAYIGGDKITKASAGTITYAAPVVTKYTVTFKANDVELSSTEYEEGTAIAVPEDPTKAEDDKYTYTFAGWYDETDAEQTVVDLTDATATATVTYVAKFDAIAKPVTPPTPDQPTTVTISYQMVKVDAAATATDATVSTADLNGGAVIYTSLTEPTLSGYGFVGWYTDEALTTKLDKAATATEAITIYAKMAKLYKIGDVDLDVRGRVNNSDLNALYNYIDSGSSDTINKIVLPGTSKKLGDVDLDVRGRVNNSDLNALYNYIDSGVSDTINTYLEIIKD